MDIRIILKWILFYLSVVNLINLIHDRVQWRPLIFVLYKNFAFH